MAAKGVVVKSHTRRAPQYARVGELNGHLQTTKQGAGPALKGPSELLGAVPVKRIAGVTGDGSVPAQRVTTVPASSLRPRNESFGS